MLRMLGGLGQHQAILKPQEPGLLHPRRVWSGTGEGRDAKNLQTHPSRQRGRQLLGAGESWLLATIEPALSPPLKHPDVTGAWFASSHGPSTAAIDQTHYSRVASSKPRGVTAPRIYLLARSRVRAALAPGSFPLPGPRSDLCPSRPAAPLSRTGPPQGDPTCPRPAPTVPKATRVSSPPPSSAPRSPQSLAQTQAAPNRRRSHLARASSFTSSRPSKPPLPMSARHPAPNTPIREGVVSTSHTNWPIQSLTLPERGRSVPGPALAADW